MELLYICASIHSKTISSMTNEDFEMLAMLENSKKEKEEKLFKLVENFIGDVKSLYGNNFYDVYNELVPQILVDKVEDVDGDLLLYGSSELGFFTKYSEALMLKRAEAYLERSIFRVLDGEKKPLNSFDFRFDGKFFDFEVHPGGYRGLVAGEVADFNGTNRYLKNLTIMTITRRKLVEYNQPQKGSHEITTGLNFYDNIKLINTIWEAITCLD